ncbi:phage head closure protein [Lysinibacillus sphaericus]|uniref:Bacteriophage head-tail adaptor n=1 Tax=Lysinibacillus sphaericus OT4b.31 TaxID=1285586 RepID=R7Z915_LYSSH|nr:phage head closure protein [Lysinibacillus sphaericus]EON70461.1 bacteriophage head-tail adaptor [Lysinibacillus sphaericus OT4b.31]
MNAGDLKHRIDIYANVEYENELGETSHSFEKLKTIWSAIIPQTGSLQKQQADTILTNVTHKIIIRYSAGNDISKEMKIKFRNHEFEIRYILNPYFNNETLEIFVQEVLG